MVTGSFLSTTEATVEVPLTTVNQLLTDTPVLQPLSTATQARSSHNQLWIRDLPFVQQRCRTAAPVRVGRVSH